MPLLITADWHICTDGRIWPYRKEPAGDIFYAVQQIIDLCKKYSVQYLVLAGDILDAVKNYPTTLAVLRRLESLPIKILYVQGQHDLAAAPWLHTLGFENAEWIHKKSVYLPTFKRRVLGLDWCPNPILELNNIYAGEEILITHQVWQDLVPNGNISFSDLPSQIEVVISGDYHLPVAEFRQGVQVLIPGTLSAASGIDQQSVILLNEDLSYSIIPLHHRKIVHCTITKPEDVDKFEAEYPPESLYDNSLPEELRKPIIFLRCSSGELIDRIAEIYKDAFLHLLPSPAVEENQKDHPAVSHSTIFEDNVREVLKSFNPDYVRNFSHIYGAIVSGDITRLVNLLLEAEACGSNDSDSKTSAD